MILKRILTRKSKLNYGKYKDLTVQKILDMKMPLILISSYFKLSKIDFQDAILNELKITEKYRVDKPCKNLEMYYIFLNENGFKKRDRNSGADKMKKFSKPFSKSQLQGFNHGR